MNTYHPAYQQCFSVETAQYRANILTEETGEPHTVTTINEGIFAAVPVNFQNDDFLTGEKIPDEVRKKPIPRNLHNKIFDDDAEYFELNLLQHVEDSHIMKRLAIAIANATQMPVSSVFLAGLGIFSAVAVWNYVVAYQYTDDIPVGLYIEIEQPSGSGKTRCLKIHQKPFFEAYEMRCQNWKNEVEKLERELEQAEKDEQREIVKKLKQLQQNPPPKPFITNATPESIETHLANSGGWFALASSEQGLINSMLGKSYNDSGRANNNDLMLNGFDGGYVASSRQPFQGVYF
jgi:hypothetical protein